MLSSRLRMRGGGSGDPYENATFRIIEPNARMSIAQSGIASNRTHQFCRMPIYIGQDAYVIKLLFWNWVINSAGVELNTGNPVNVLALSIEDTSGNYMPVSFTSGRNLIMADGADDITTLNISPFGGRFKWTRGEQYWVRMIMSVNSSAHFNMQMSSKTSTGITGAQYQQFDPSVTTINGTSGNTNWAGAVDATGLFAWTGTTPANGAQGYVPNVIGVPFVDEVSEIEFGDSKTFGANEVIGSNPWAYGYMSRAAVNQNVSPIPCLNMGRSSTGLDYLINGTKWKSRLKYVNSFKCTYGVNDYNIAKAFSTFETQLGAVLAEINALPNIRNVALGDMTPYTTSTDGFSTTANQALKIQTSVNFAEWQDKYNTMKDTFLGNGTITHFFERFAVRAAAKTPVSLTASQSGTLLTVTAITGTPLGIGSPVTISGGLTARITALGTGTGGTGTYTVDVSQTVASAAGTAIPVNYYKWRVPADLNTITASQTTTTLTVTAISGTGTLALGSPVYLGSGAVATITAFGTGSGGTGTYTVTPSQTIGSTSGFANMDTSDGLHENFTAIRDTITEARAFLVSLT